MQFLTDILIYELAKSGGPSDITGKFRLGVTAREAR